MSPVVEGVACSVVASMMVGVYNKLYLAYNLKKEKDIKKEAIEIINLKFKHDYNDLMESVIFEKYLKLPQISDLICNYLTYKINGVLSEKLLELKAKKKTDQFVEEEDVIKYLSCKLEEVFTNGSLIIPKYEKIESFFKRLFAVLPEFFIEHISREGLSTTFLVNNHIDKRIIIVENKLDIIVQKLNKSLSINIQELKAEYEETRDLYNRCLKRIYEKGFIYLIGEFKFNDFYVAPDLCKIQNSFHDKWKNIVFLKKENQLNNIKNTEINIEYHSRFVYENHTIIWKNIFEETDIVYIIGGAGYGKSLFMINLINNYDKLNIYKSFDYLIIYCELKTFYADQNKGSKSIMEFLQESIINTTGLDKGKISLDFLQYYMNMGRCIILFDALDEVSKNHRHKLHRMITSFFQTCNPNNKVLITSRDRGFIPEDDIEVICIESLSREQISEYVDKIIKLKEFKQSDKETFMRQADILIEKKFLNNFLVLSLLVNIYKSERELPENKIDLYEKCFEYIAKKREKEKSKTRYDWALIEPLMKDSTFIELAQLACPNNNDVEKIIIEQTLLKLYKSKYSDECKTENAINIFLEFCADRTELFVPSAGEDKFKFFHRSFFEFFYAKYICRSVDPKDIYSLMKQFDVDSEIFELTIAMIKKSDELKYQKVISYIFNEIFEDFNLQKPTIIPLNILTIIMQVVDDVKYRFDYVDIFVRNSKKIFYAKDELRNKDIVINILKKAVLLNERKYYEFASEFEQYVFLDILIFINYLEIGNEKTFQNREKEFKWLLLTREIKSHMSFYSHIVIESEMYIFEIMEKYIKMYNEMKGKFNVISQNIFDKRERKMYNKIVKKYVCLEAHDKEKLFKDLYLYLFDVCNNLDSERCIDNRVMLEL